MRMIECKTCGARIAASADRCPKCGGVTLAGAVDAAFRGVWRTVDFVILAGVAAVGLVLLAVVAI